jgi:hypothetical protein
MLEDSIRWPDERWLIADERCVVGMSLFVFLALQGFVWVDAGRFAAGTPESGRDVLIPSGLRRALWEVGWRDARR